MGASDSGLAKSFEQVCKVVVEVSDDNGPVWKNGDYTSPPPGMVSACQILFIMVRSRLVLQTQAPTTVAADQMLDKAVQGMVAQFDANDFLYQFESMRDYNPEPDLEKIQARVLAINFADDQESPPELGILEAAMKRIKRGQAVIVPASDKTRGHITFTVPTAGWGNLNTYWLADVAVTLVAGLLWAARKSRTATIALVVLAVVTALAALYLRRSGRDVVVIDPLPPPGGGGGSPESRGQRPRCASRES